VYPPDKSPPQIVLIEVGGTVGDIESQIYYEAIRQLKLNVGPKNMVIVFSIFDKKQICTRHL